jgi:Ribonuclease HI
MKKTLKLPNQKEDLKSSINPLSKFHIEAYTNLEVEMNKQDTAPSVAKTLALDTINSKYPSNNWLHIYTDGSLQDVEEGAGAGIYCELFSFYKNQGSNTTNFDGEITAIDIALQHILYRTNEFQNAVILSDSKAAIQAISNYSEDPSSTIREIRSKIKQIYNLKKKLVLQWVPAHCGLIDNENADYLPKKGTKISIPVSQTAPFESVKRLIKTKYRENHKKWINNVSTDKKWRPIVENPNLIPNLPRKAAVTHFRLITGHDCLAQHLRKIGIRNSPNCPLCSLNTPMNSSHLNSCLALKSSNNIVEKYWDARGRMT